MDPGHRLAQFAHRIIGILDMHTDRRIGQHAAGGAVLIVKRGIAQRHIEIERSEERRVGKDVSVRVDLGGRRIIKKKKREQQSTNKPKYSSMKDRQRILQVNSNPQSKK